MRRLRGGRRRLRRLFFGYNVIVTGKVTPWKTPSRLLFYRLL